VALSLVGREFEVLTRRPMEVNTDGEVTTRTPARFSVLPAALEVVVP
jgi:diacylglycerol kinase family enzyme